ncbi:MAG: DMT family transporter [Gammaproteobacteria bacterium]|nr:DMT family transporter [Gammaproteobacteria bacterium]
MPISAAYLGIILIWSTTPLAIKWSSEGPGFMFGATARMAIGAALCLLLLRALRMPLPWHGAALRSYAAANLGIFGAMVCVYWGAQHVPSGLISALFGLTPIITGFLAAVWLKERALTPAKIAGSVIGLGGLWLIFGDERPGTDANLGLAAVLAAVFLHSLSTVWVKRAGSELPALTQTTGALLLSLPCYLLTWLLLDGHPPPELPPRALLAIAYLGIFGSVAGFILYYYALKRVTAGRMALLLLVTPVIALLFGHFLNGETFGAKEIAGTALILSGLLFYETGERLIQALRKDGA